MTDPYDLLMDQALLKGIRVSPLFRVFVHPEGWAVQATDLQGDPSGEPHKIYKSMRRAFNLAGKLNADLGCGPALNLNASKRAA